MSATQAATYRQQYRILSETLPLTTFSLAFDLILIRLSNPTYSKYGKLSKLLHTLLIDLILSSQAQKKYANILRNYQYLLSWGKLQSFLHHLGSYSLQEHAR